MNWITDIATLEALYPEPPKRASLAKVTPRLTPSYRAWIERSRFCLMASVGPEGTDCSPRGDAGPVVQVLDEGTLLMPDWRGNNRIDSLRNIVADPRVALLFLIPGLGETLRVNGRAHVSIDPALIERFTVQGKPPRSVLAVDVETVFFQCARAIARSRLWDRERHVTREALPSAGRILADFTAGRLGGDAYDREQPEKMRTTLY